MQKANSLKKTLMMGKIKGGGGWGGVAVNEMAGWHHQLNGHEFEQTLGDGDCSNEIKRRLLLGRKAMTNLDSILKTETLLC